MSYIECCYHWNEANRTGWTFQVPLAIEHYAEAEYNLRRGPFLDPNRVVLRLDGLSQAAVDRLPPATLIELALLVRSLINIRVLASNEHTNVRLVTR